MTECKGRCKRLENLIGEFLKLVDERKPFGDLEYINFGPAYAMASSLDDKINAKIEEMRIAFEATK